MGYLNEDGLATLVGKVKGQVVQLTAAEYRQIPAETKNFDNKIYFVEDDDYAYAIDNEPTLNSENLVKSGGVYNYTSKIGTGALTTTAQTLIPAVNELKAAVDTNTSDIAELNNGISKFKVQTGVITWTGTGSGWSYAHVTFPAPYRTTPIISVLPNTAYANPAKVPAIRNQNTTGFDIGFYNHSGTFQFMWWAFGEEE